MHFEEDAALTDFLSNFNLLGMNVVLFFWMLVSN